MSPSDFQNVFDFHKIGSYSLEQQGMFLLFHVKKCQTFIRVKYNYLNCKLAK